METPQRAAMRPVRVGIFDGIATADAAIVRLMAAGFTQAEISVVAPKSMSEHFGREHVEAKEPGGSHALHSATTGGVVGAVLGGILAAAAVVGTGGAALLIAGPLLAGAGVGAASGGFIGAMMSRGFEKETAQFYDQALKPGKVLVGVECEGTDQRARLSLAERVLAESGAEPLRLVKG